MSIDSITTIGIAGAGTMGKGIAQACATAGFEVLLFDIQPALVSRAMTGIEKNFDTLVQKNKIQVVEKELTLSRIKPITEISQLKAQLVIEAVIEKLDVKQKLFAELERVNDSNSILATNTSSIPVTQIAASLQHTGRFAGLHFFNPAPVMKLVEIVSASFTTQHTIQRLQALAQKLSKQAVLVQDSPGFVVNRVARHYYVEALKVLEENAADVNTIDTLLRATGFKMGPFELMDLIGIDVNFSVTSSLYNAFYHDPKFRPSRIQQQKVDALHHGRKSGKGFYDYT